MISVAQIHFVEQHWEAIATRALTRIHKELTGSQPMPDQMILDRSQELFGHLGDWLAAADPAKHTIQYERIGRVRAQEKILLSDLVRCVQILRQSAVDYLRENDLPEHVVQIRSENELEYRIDRFFDQVVHQLIRGYENEFRLRSQVSAAAR